jgi:hypothetical protein
MMDKPNEEVPLWYKYHREQLKLNKKTDEKETIRFIIRGRCEF